MKKNKIKVGLIIFLENEEECPADIILLSSSEIKDKEAICFIDSHLITGRRDLQLKKASFLTNSTKFSQNTTSRKMEISCKLDYSHPNPNIDSFVGYLKLLNDPKIEKLTNDNFIPKGSIIEKASWIIGLVIYSGSDTKLMKNTKFKFYKSSFLENLSQIYFLTICGFVIICSIVRFFFKYFLNFKKFFFFFFFLNKIIIIKIDFYECFFSFSLGYLFNKQKIGEIMVYSSSLNQDSQINSNNFNHLFLLTTMFPLDFFCLSELWFLYVKYSLEKKLKMDNSLAVINSPNIISNLAHVDYAIFDKTGTITTQNRNLSLLYIKEIGDIFEFHDLSHFLENFYTASHKKICTKCMVIEKEPEKILLKEPNLVNCKKFFDDFYTTEGFNGFHHLLEAFLLCNTLKMEYSKSKNLRKLKFRTKDEKFLFNFAQYLDYEFVNFYKKDKHVFHTIRIRKNIYDYEILDIHESAYNLLTILYHDPIKNNYFIACQGHSSNLIKKLKFSKEELQILESIMMIFYKKGFIDPLMYAKKVITKEEADAFFEKSKNLHSSLINQNDSLSELMSELSFDLELVGNEFFEINLFFIMETFFLLIFGVTLMFIREFYGKIAKKVFFKNFLLVLFLIGMGACFLEIYTSKIMENYSTSFMTLAILHTILTNVWLILFLYLFFLKNFFIVHSVL